MGYLGKGPGIRTVLLLRHKSGRLYYVRTFLIAHPLHISCALYLACSDPPEGRDHWTLQLLADELVVLGLVASLSTETVRQALKKTRAAKSTGVTAPQAARDRPLDPGESADAASAGGGGSPERGVALARH